MATNKAARGTKRTCQNDECGSRFYDLNRNPITCPICQSAYVIASAPMLAAAPAPVVDEKAARKAKPPEPVAADELPEGELPPDAEDALADVEVAEEPAAAEEDETFLEEEEEGGDVSNILGGPVAEDQEET